MPAFATPVTGQAVGGGTDGDGWTDFYIPLNGDPEIYDGTLDRDHCNTGSDSLGTCTGGSIEMTVHVAADWSGTTGLAIWFDDFDVVGLNDPDYFFETLALQVVDTSSGIPIMSWSMAEVAGLVTGNHDEQHLALSFDIDGAFDVVMNFGTLFGDGTPNDTRFGNTLESVKVIAVSAPEISVPEPGTLALLGAGLLFLGFTGRRRLKV